MSDLIFNPPQGWPTPPKGWRPHPEWQPDPSWPAAPSGWEFWIPESPLPAPQASNPITPAFPTSRPVLKPPTLIPAPDLPPTVQTPPTRMILNHGAHLQESNEVFDRLGISEEQPKELVLDSQMYLVKADLEATITDTKKITPAIRQTLLSKVSYLFELQKETFQRFQQMVNDDVEIYNKVEAVNGARSFNKLLAIREQAITNLAIEEKQMVEDHLKEMSQIQSNIEKLNAELSELQAVATLQEVSLYEYFNPAENSVELKKSLDDIKQTIKNVIVNGNAINATANFSYNNSVEEGSKFVKDFSNLMLTAYNQEVENAIVKAERGKDIYAALKRVDKAAEKVQKLGTMLSMSVAPHFHTLRKKEIELAFTYKERVAKEKEEERERKLELREQERIEREARKQAEDIRREERELLLQLKAKEAEREAQRLEAMRQLEENRIAGLEKEALHYQNVLAMLDEEDPAVTDLKLQLNKVESAKQKNSDILANNKAGYVYVISNVGSFGEGVVKIGLTRRAEPMDRVKELGDASVPFVFDVHILHFSNNAVTLEKALHQRFANQAINKVNSRKEFFRTTPEKVKEAMTELSDGPLLTFTEIPEASDYRMSLELMRESMK